MNNDLIEDDDGDIEEQDSPEQSPEERARVAKERNLEALRRGREKLTAWLAAGNKRPKPKTPEEKFQENPGNIRLAVRVYCREWTGYLNNRGCEDAPVEAMRQEALAMYAAAKERGLPDWVRETCLQCVSAANNQDAMRDIRHCNVTRCALRAFRPYKQTGERAEGTAPAQIPAADAGPPFSADFLCRAVRALEEYCVGNRLELPLSRRTEVIMGLYGLAKTGQPADAAAVGRLLEPVKA